jgi:hypothetical protein
MSVKNCYVEEKINDSGGSNEVLGLEIEQNTADIGILQTGYDLLKLDVLDDEKLIDINTTQLASNTTQFQTSTEQLAKLGTAYAYPVSDRS